MHFHSRGTTDSDANVRMPDGTVVKPKLVLWWLAVWFDRKMDFKHHVQTKATSATRAFMTIACLDSYEKGLSPQALKQLFHNCLATISDFGAEVWWKGQVGLSNFIQQARDAAIHKVAGAFRTTSTTALQVETALPDTAIRVEAMQQKYAHRLRSMLPTHPLLDFGSDTCSSSQQSQIIDNPKCPQWHTSLPSNQKH